MKLEADAFDKVEVYRALRKDGDYGEEPFFTSRTDRYYNTATKKGTRYYYKVKGYKDFDDETVCTEFSLRANRIAK